MRARRAKPKPAAPRERRGRRGAWPSEPTWEDRFADRLDPILVRDLVQTSQRPAFPLGVVIASIVILDVAFDIPGTARSTSDGAAHAGFVDLAVLAACLCWGAVPLLSFLSMREELDPSTREQLVLSGVTPSRIVRGKVGSAAILTLATISLALPVFAFAYVHRGTSLPSLALCLSLVLCGSITLTTIAVALACATRALQPRAVPIALAAGMFGGTAWLAIVHGPAAIDALESTIVGRDATRIATLVLALLFAAATSWQVGVATLAQPHDNRSTGFRIVGAGIAPALLITVLLTSPRSELADDLSRAALSAAIALVPFWVFATTEPIASSPRLLAHLPARGFLGILSAPFQPGAGRGLCWTALVATLLLALGAGVPWLVPSPTPSGADLRAVVVLAVAYMLVFAPLGTLLRAKLDRDLDPRARWLAPMLVPGIAVAAWVVPAIVNGIRGVRSVEWSLLHVLNPVTTSARIARDGLRTDVIVALAVIALPLWLLALPAIATSLRESSRGAVLPVPADDEAAA